MINKTQVICSSSFDPYHNLALEEYLLDSVGGDTCILYLWQNRHTVVIGQNQNAWQECRVKELEADGGHLARRLSGGGAVFHDLGNLNFTFLIPRKDYDIARQLEVIRLAAASYGLEVERSGRNDMLINGRKFSGNAFFKRKNSAYHHGTILLSSDMTVLPKYLNVSKEKLESKGVKSVASRVGNLCEFCPEITVEGMKERLIDAMEQVYGSRPEIIEESSCEGERLRALTEKYASWDWRFGKRIPFKNEISKRFPWGGISINLSVEHGLIKDAAIYSDAMDSDFILALSEALKGRKYTYADIHDGIMSVETGSELGYEADASVIRDIDGLIAQQNL